MMAGGRAGVARENSDPSALPFGHTLDWGGLFRVPVFDQLLKSPAPGMELPLVCAFEMTVDVDELEDVDDTDDEELVR